MQTDQTIVDINEILNSQRLGVLATYGSEYPYTTIVGFAFTDDLHYIIFATFRETRKYANIKMNPRVSILFDNCSNSASDFSDAKALTALGNVEELCKDGKNEFKNLYLKRHPYLNEFISDPNCALIKIKVDKYILVSRFQQVMELDMT